MFGGSGEIDVGEWKMLQALLGLPESPQGASAHLLQDGSSRRDSTKVQSVISRLTKGHRHRSNRHVFVLDLDLSSEQVTASELKDLLVELISGSKPKIDTRQIIRSINGGSKYLGVEGAQSIAEVLRKNPIIVGQSLEYLVLGMNDLRDEGITALSTIFHQQKTKTQRHLQELALAGDSEDEENVIVKSGGHEVINRHYCFKYAAAASALVSLDVRFNDIGPTGIDALFRSIGGCVMEVCAGSESSLNSTNFTNSANLECEGDCNNDTDDTDDTDNTDDSDDVRFCHSCPLQLQSLDLTRNRIGNDGAFSLVEKVLLSQSPSAAKLQSINLSGNNITDVGIQAIAHALTAPPIGRRRQRLLAKATKSANRMHSEQQNLAHAHSLCSPALGSRLDMAAALESLRIPSQPCSLVELDLRWNRIGCKGAIALAMALRTNDTLQVLDLSGTSIGFDGLKALHEMVTLHNDTLRTLNLHGNKFNDLSRPGMAQLLLYEIRTCITANSTPVVTTTTIQSGKLGSRTIRRTMTRSRVAPEKANRQRQDMYHFLLDHWISNEV